jgi:phage terminase large subunit-like protein
MVESAQSLADEGLPMIEVPQTLQRLVPAYSTLHHLIIGRMLDHDDDPQLRSHVISAVPSVAANGGFVLAKNKSRRKIDGCVAMAIALAGSGEVEEPEADATDEMLRII